MSIELRPTQVVFEVTVERGGHEIEVEVTPHGEWVEVEEEEER